MRGRLAVSVPKASPDSTPEGARPAGRGYWFTPLPTYLLDAVYDPASPVNAPAAILWAHIHRHYAWRERIFPSCATLADETGLGERTIARLLQALRSAGALTWDAGFSPKGRSSNRYALAPFKPFEFDREPSPSVPAENGNHSGEPAKSGSHRPAKSGSHPSAKNGRGIKSSSYLESTEDHLSSPPSPEPRAESAAADEREIEASPSKPALTTAQRVIRAAAVLSDGEDETAFLDWVTAVHEPRSGAWWRTVRDNGDLPDLADAWRTETAPTPAAAPQRPAKPPHCGDPDCDPITRTRDQEQGDFRLSVRCQQCHPDMAPTRASLRQDTASHNAGVLARARQRARGHQPYQCPTDQSVYDLDFYGRPATGTDSRPLPGTDANVAGWAAVARRLDDGTGS
jgi:hypothetical protein